MDLRIPPSATIEEMFFGQYTEDDRILMDSIDALLDDSQPPSMFFDDLDTYFYQNPSTPPAVAAEDAFQFTHAQTFETADFDIGSPSASPRALQYAEPQCVPSNKPINSRKRSLSQALSFKSCDVEPVPKRSVVGTSYQQEQEQPLSLNVVNPFPVNPKPRVRSPQAEKPKHLTSSYRGVCWYKRTQRWVVQIKIKGVRVHIGYYKNEVDAACAYERAMEKIAENPDINRSELRALA